MGGIEPEATAISSFVMVRSGSSSEVEGTKEVDPNDEAGFGDDVR